jgi:hypothetical protein
MASRSRKRKRRGGSFQAPPKRGQVTASAAEASAATPRPKRRGGRPERPPAPWGSFPLVELVVLLAIVMLIAGFFFSGTKGITMIATGLTLGMLAGLELSIREHFAGYKSHTTVLAGFPAVLVLGIGFWQEWPRPVNLLAAALLFATGFYLLREAFKRRSGGLGFR